MKSLLLLLTILAFANAEPTRRLFNAKKANPRQFPYMVSIQDQKGHRCGGAIYNSRYIITAAHCIYVFNKWKIRVGASSVSDGIKYDVERGIPHPNYTSAGAKYDIGLLKTSTDIVFNDDVRPIPIAQDDTAAGTSGIVSGYGSTSNEGGTSGTLLYLNVTVEDKNQCKATYEFFDDTFLCTKGEKGTGVCDYDSGSPLVVNGELVAVVQGTPVGPCATGASDIYTRVHPYETWITETVSSDP